MEQLPMRNGGTVATSCANNLTSYNPKALDGAFRGRIGTALEAADSGAVCLWTLRYMHNDEKVAALLNLYLIRMNNILGLKRPLTDEMIAVISAGIIAEFSSLNMADVWLVLNRAITGVYGEMYESLNPPKVLGWFREYWNERLNMSEERNIQRAENWKQEGSRTAQRIIERIEHYGATKK